MLAKQICLVLVTVAIACSTSAFDHPTTLSSGRLLASNQSLHPNLVDTPIQWAIVQSEPSILQNQMISAAESDHQGAMLQRHRLEGRIDQVTFERTIGTLGDLIGYDLAGYAVAVLLAIPLPFLFRLRSAQYSAAQAAKRDEYLRERIAEARIYSEPNRIPLGAFEDRKI